METITELTVPLAGLRSVAGRGPPGKKRGRI